MAVYQKRRQKDPQRGRGIESAEGAGSAADRGRELPEADQRAGRDQREPAQGQDGSLQDLHKDE